MSKERYKDVIGYEGLYQVSNLGNVKSTHNKKHKILKPSTYSRYLLVTLSKDKTSLYVSIHRLVATHFKKNLKNLPCVNHKNGDRRDNRSINLEWVTYKQNTIHAYKLGSFIPPNTSKPINQLTLNGIFIKKWPSGREIERNLKIWAANIQKCCSNKAYKQSGGFKWEYANKDTT